MTTTKKTKKVSKRKATPTDEQKWEGLKETANTEDVQSYNVNGNFAVNTAIQHPKFGMGIVIESLHHKIEVQFQDGLKSLVQNRG